MLFCKSNHNYTSLLLFYRTMFVKVNLVSTDIYKIKEENNIFYCGMEMKKNIIFLHLKIVINSLAKILFNLRSSRNAE